MKKTLSISFLAIFVLVGFANANVGQETRELREKVKIRVAQTKEINGKNCEIIKDKTENKISYFNEKREKQLDTFKKIRTKLEKFVDRATEAGYDTEKLAIDLADYDTKVTTFESDYNLYLKLLGETKEYSCERSLAEYKTKLKAAREQLKVVQKDAVELKTFYAKTLRPDLLALKKQKSDNSETETNEEAVNEIQ